MITCSVCNSPEWITCHPGQAAESRVLEDGVFRLHPAVEVADTAWCKAHWPKHVAPKRRRWAPAIDCRSEPFQRGRGPDHLKLDRKPK
jgi:hypothetical protein